MTARFFLNQRKTGGPPLQKKRKTSNPDNVDELFDRRGGLVQRGAFLER